MRMDDIDGNNPLDLSSYGNDGTVFGDATLTNGFFGQGFEFDGDNDFIRISHDSSIDFNGQEDSFSIAAWIYPTSFGGWRGIVTKGRDYTGVYQWYGLWLEDNQAVFGLDMGEVNLHCSEALTPNTWYHIVSTYKPDSQHIYLNGVECGSDAGTANITNPRDLAIGRALGQQEYFNGTIDEVFIFRRTLSQQEIKSLYDAGLYQYGHDFVDLAGGRYDFTGYAVDTVANRGQTETRHVRIWSGITPQIGPQVKAKNISAVPKP